MTAPSTATTAATTTTTTPTASVPRRRPGRPGPALPAAGPAWFPAVMGTGILTTLLATYGGPAPVHGAARVLLVVAWLLLLGLAVAGAVVARRPRLPAPLARPTDRAQWGAVAMGVTSVASATLAVGAGSGTVRVALALWLVGTALGLVTVLGFTARLVRSEAGAPSFVWGLPLVPPMVSATAGAALVPHLSPHPTAAVAVLVASVSCFPVALALGVVVFAVGYHHHWRVAPLPLAASASAWIPLGIVGQSVAAAQAIATSAGPWLTPHAASLVRSLAAGYGLVVLALGVPLAAWAAVVTVRGFALRMPFTPGWWALTFPIGTLSLGLHHLGLATQRSGLVAGGGVVLAVLCGTWTLCALASVGAVGRVLTEWRSVGTTRRPR